MLNHMHRSHGYKHVSRFYTMDNICIACLTCFDNRSAAIHHYRSKKGKQCLDLIMSIYRPMSAEATRDLDSAALEKAKQCRGQRTAHAYRQCGPFIHTDMASCGLRCFH